jgi:hypothetical protein
MAMRIAQLKKLEQNGALRLLVLIAERDRFITELLKSSVNPSGIISLDSLRKCRLKLGELGLITEKMETDARRKTYLSITEDGKRVADLVLRILEIIDK